MENVECWNCNVSFDFNSDDTHVSCDVVEGQFVEFTAVNCPVCKVENRW